MESAIFKDQAAKFLEQLEREHRDLSAQIIAFKRAFKLGHGLSDELIDERRHGSQWQQLVDEAKSAEEVPFIADESGNKWRKMVDKARERAEKKEAIVDSHNNLEIQDMICKIMTDIDGATTQEIAQQLKDWGVVRKDSNFNRLVGSLCYGLQGQGKLTRNLNNEWVEGSWMNFNEEIDE